jgi:large subunit ribosomal protein L7A
MLYFSCCVKEKQGQVMQLTLEELKNSKAVVGMKETARAIEKKEAVVVFIASDCDDRIAGPLKESAREAGIPVENSFTRKEIGRACGIKVKAAACAVVSTR